jgi:hypothetical protein
MAATITVASAVSHLPGVGAVSALAAAGPEAATAAGPPGGEGTFWLSYHKSRDSQKLLRYLGRQSLSVTAERPTDLSLPGATGPQVRFAQWSTPMDPAGFRHVALARSEQSALCDQLIIDTNGDGRLDDESICKPNHVQQYGRGNGWAHFGPVALQFDSPDGPILYHLNFRIYSSGPEQYHASAMAGGWYQGAVQLNGKATECQLIDFNANGTFNDTCGESTGYSSADRVRFTIDSAVEPVFAGRYVREGDRLYEFAAAQDGAYVTIRLSEDVATGTIAPPDDFGTVKVYGPQGSFAVQAGAIQDVPSGRYWLESWQREVSDDSGRLWRFTGRGFPEDAAVDVTDDTESGLELGEPWAAKLTDRVSNRKHSIDQTLVGRLGERVDASYADGQRPPAPRLKIVSDDGGYERSFKFEYG